MAQIKVEKGPFLFKPGLSEEDRAAAMAAFSEHFVGLEQQMIGSGRAEAVSRFIELLNSGGPDRVKKLENEIKELHGMEKFERFRTQFFLILIDVFQSGMYFALDQKAIDNDWELLKVLHLAQPDKK